MGATGRAARCHARRTSHTTYLRSYARRSTLHRDVYGFSNRNIRRRWFVTPIRHRSALGSTSYRYRAESRSRKEEWSQPRARALPFAGSRGLRIAPTPTHGPTGRGSYAVRGIGGRPGVSALSRRGGAARRGARPPGRPGARRGGLRYTRGPVPVRSRPVPGRDANSLLLLLHYYDVNQRRTRVFESNRPSPVFVVVSPRERPMTASRGARARHRIDVPSR